MSIRVYADTSVYGGCFDPEFARASTSFFDGVREARFALVTSALVVDEVARAPDGVRNLLNEMLVSCEQTDVTDDAVALRNAYLAAGIVTARSRADALHVALAAVARCDAIVSWNFRHIVRFDRIPLYNAISVVHGFRELAIHSPLEVLSYGTRD